MAVTATAAASGGFQANAVTVAAGGTPTADVEVYIKDGVTHLNAYAALQTIMARLAERADLFGQS